jgi:hypothetical protein
VIRLRRLPALVATSALIAVGLTVSQPTTAKASDFCLYDDTTRPTINGYAPTSVTLGLSSKLVQFSVRATDNCPIDDWSISTPDAALFFVYKSSPKDTIYAFDNDDAGATAADVTVYDQAYNVQKRRFTFRLLRHTRWQTFNASPEPVRKGARVTIKATMQRADWDKNAYVRFGGSAQRATVQFKAKGGTRWIPVKTVAFTSTGQISTQVTVKREVARDGYYRVHFAGTAASSAAASTPDYVNVR